MPYGEASPLGALIDRHHDKLKNNRHNWERQWQNIAEYVLPHRADFITAQSKGNERLEMAFEGTALRLLKRFASNIHNVFTPMGAEWFKLTTGVSQLDKNRNVALWLEEGIFLFRIVFLVLAVRWKLTQFFVTTNRQQKI
jgi:hypothetical protein